MSVDSSINKQILVLPDSLKPVFESYWRQFEAHGAILEQDDACLSTVATVWAVSEFVAINCLRHPSMLQQLIESGDMQRCYGETELTERISSLLVEASDEIDLKKRLREIRRREMVRIAWRDLAGWAKLVEVMAVTSELAEACTDAALKWLCKRAVDKYGQPIGESSRQLVYMTVLGMGKLGGLELNFSSDIDLMFFYSEKGETDSNESISNHQFFVRLGQKVIAVLNEQTEDGFVFRVDMRLRPNGDSGPIALSFDAAEFYYQTHGREWERYALIKARVIAGDRHAGAELLSVLRPFIYRRYLDYGAIEAIRLLKSGINQELSRKGIEHNIKLGPGGIREIEFIGQAFQLIRGGREPQLQQRSILPVLVSLGEMQVLTARTVTELTAAYIFLRRSENRLQMMTDKQTHILPDDEQNRMRLAFSMGYSDWPAYVAALKIHMQKVHENFSQVFVAPQGETDLDADDGIVAVWMNRLDRAAALQMLEQTGFTDEPKAALDLVRGLREGSQYRMFSSEGRQRMDQLMPLLLSAAGLAPHPQTTLSRLVTLVEAIGRRSAYLALMLENPLVLSQLVKLCSASPWISEWITRHPLLLDELLSPVDAFESPSSSQLGNELETLLQDTGDDEERQMEVLREFCNRHVLHVAAADVGPGLSPEEIGRQLSRVAEVLIQACVQLSITVLQKRHGHPLCTNTQSGGDVPGFIVVGYGKLGSHELGYGSDVDMIFLYEACSGGAGETTGPRALANETYFARLGQRIIHLLTTRTVGGILYETDMRLRPSGQSGPLVTSLSAFVDYQEARAWTWEQQALVRARPVAGDPALMAAFEQARTAILCRPRDQKTLVADVIAMRDKMFASQKAHDPALFDIKHDRGGIVDIEFMVQYWVLRWAGQYPELTQYTDNAAILKALARAGLLEQAQAELLVSAYHHYLSTAYRLKLMQEGSLTGLDAVDAYPEQIKAVWLNIFHDADHR